ncbi:MAG: DMT family transporter [Muribaculaceae bacterium]|nr:DMT family transporter [Muribaculaceae bacterium]MDE6321438.1 DMT family transporter [Muribaculaceae bacterium]
MKSLLRGNVAMGVSKTFSGLNENALRYLLPTWMSAYSGVLLRLGFGAIAFWALSLFTDRQAVHTSVRERIGLFMLGAITMTGYMTFLLLGLTYTTPISSSIFISIEPVIVFIICVIFYQEKVSGEKLIGIVMGLGGAVLCICTQQKSSIATDPLFGNSMCACSAVCYSIFLVLSARYLKRIDPVTVSKWTFLGGACSAAGVVCYMGWNAPVLDQWIFSTPMLVLAFVLVFPSFISYFLVDVGLKNLKPTVVALYGYVILIVAAGVSYALGQDHFSWWQMASIALIVASIYFVEVAEHKPTQESGRRLS